MSHSPTLLQGRPESYLNVGEGDEVLIPSLTMAAVLNAVLTVGAKPVGLCSRWEF